MTDLNEELEKDLKAAYGIDENEDLWSFCIKCATMRKHRIVIALGHIQEVCGTCLDVGKVEEEVKPVYRLQKRPRQ